MRFSTCTRSRAGRTRTGIRTSYGRITLIWHHPHFQDRFVALWEEFARRYKGNPVIAGYNVMNEPVTGAPYGFFGYPYKPDWERPEPPVSPGRRGNPQD